MDYNVKTEKMYILKLTEEELRAIVHAYGSCSYENVQSKFSDLFPGEILVNPIRYQNIYMELNKILKL